MTYEGQQSGDIRATLALSREEAMNGTSRTLNLPGGRQIVVPVPAGIRDGQEIRLEGQGQPSMYGGRGTLILTIALVPAQGQVHEENFGRQPYAQPESDSPTEFISTPPPPPPTFGRDKSGPYPSIGQEGAFTNYPPQGSRPAINNDYTEPAYAQRPGFAGYATPPQQQYIAPQLPPQTFPPAAQQPRQRRGLSAGMTILLIVLALLVIGGSGFIVYATVIQPNQLHAAATATTVARTTGTAQANATATAQVQATAQAQTNATATAHALAFAQATATTTALQNIYTQATSGSPALSDPLSQQDANNWEVDTKTGGGGCAFTGGAYHASMPQAGFFASCYAQGSNFSNFALQVQMTILKGDRGGIIFRANSNNTKFFLLRIGQDGSYTLFRYVDTNGNDAKTLFQGSSSAIQTGLNQTNKVAVVFRGSNLYFYVNQQYVASVNDGSYTSGEIGVFADDQSNATEVAFSNLKVWTL